MFWATWGTDDITVSRCPSLRNEVRPFLLVRILNSLNINSVSESHTDKVRRVDVRDITKKG